MATLEQLLTEGRSYKTYHPTEVPLETLNTLWTQTALAPTANNCGPLRVVFATTAEAIETLAQCAHGYNADRVKTAPAAAILAYDLAFYEQFPTLAPHIAQPAPQASWSIEQRATMALRNANLQAGFMILAARNLGLDCGPMGGFDETAIAEHFFTDPNWRFNFVILLGQGDPEALYPRAARLDFDTACRVV